MNDQVSFGSHSQYLPQAASAQIAPAMMVNVHSGKTRALIR